MFQADIAELMNLIIHSFYSNRDVFLRELISNSSDAIDKQRHFDLGKGITQKEYKIRINPFVQAADKCLVLEDDGVGMSEEDLVQNLSTIAKSGTKEFVKSLAEKSDQIGQFGVGFYSAFLVADRVDVLSRKEGAPLLKWSSDANQFYTIETVEDVEDFPAHGTRITLHLKEDCFQYLEEGTLRQIISQHSSFILHPVQLLIEKEIEVPLEEDEVEEVEEETIQEGSDKPTVEEVDIEDDEEEKKEEEEKKPKTKKEKVQEWEKVNTDLPIWYKRSSENTEEDYHSLYKTISKDFEKPLFYRHFQTEGAYEFRGVLFVPSKAPFDYLADRSKDKRNIKLYVKKVLVLKELDKEMLPDWMNFVVGVIDSADLPLNVSREMLQQTKIVKAMKTQLKKQVMSMMADLYADETKYMVFYQNFSRNIKLGVHEGDETLLSYLRMKNNKKEGTITFEEYVSDYLQEEQKSIYYLTGTDGNESQMGKIYTNKGYGVLYFDEPIDEFMLQRTNKYKDYELVNICKDHTTPWSGDASTTENEEAYKEFCEWAKKSLGDDDVESVRISTKLTTPEEVPGMVLSSKWGWTGNFEKIMKAQPLGDQKGMAFMKGKRIFEVNVQHPFIARIYSSYKSEEQQSDLIQQLKVVYQCSLISGGYPLDNLNGFVQNVYRTMDKLVPSVSSAPVTTTTSETGENQQSSLEPVAT